MTIKRDFSHINKTFCRSALLLAATLTVAACYEGAGHFAAAHSIASSAANAQSTETARSAYDFVNSIGANTHLNYFDRAYGNFPFVEHELASIGIRHLRDGVHLQNANYNSGLYGRWVKLGNLGIRFDAVVDPRSNLGPVTPALLQQAYDLSGHTIELFEGPNELDVSGVSDWPTVDRSYDQAVFNAVRAMRNGPSVQVIGPSMAFAAHGAAVGNLSSAIDFGNLHSYPAGKMPSIIFPDQLLLARSISGNHAVIMTESGYHNALNDHHDQPAVSESAAARYIPRLFLENFAHEIPRTYLYEFLDEAADPGLKDNQLHWGLIRFDGTEKPAFNALKNLIAELADNAEPSQCSR